MALTVRLPEGLQRDANAYAESVGISLNALIAVALRDYLFGVRTAPGAPRVTGQAEGQPVSEPAPARELDAPPAAVEQPGAFFPGGKRKPCRCGSGKPWRNCHGRDA